MTSVDIVERRIAELEQNLQSKPISDYNIVLSFLKHSAKYEDLVTEGASASSEFYIKKEAYRRIANQRGYTDEVLLEERNRT